jgi:hypothetical protein
MLPTAQLTHGVPGRLRFRVQSKRGDATYFGDATKRLASCPDIESITCNPLTGSILLATTAEARAIAGFAEQQGVFALLSGATFSAPELRIKGEIHAVDEALRTISNGTAGLKGATLSGLLILILYQVLKGRILAPAVTLVWYAFMIWRTAGDYAERNIGDL